MQSTPLSPKANDTQVGGAHYKDTVFQHWDFAAEAQFGYFEGQITKYLDRYARKNGLQDVQKARHFTAKLIELAEEKTQLPVHRGASMQLVRRYFEDRRGVWVEAQRAITMISLWGTVAQLRSVLGYIDLLEARLSGAAPTPAYVNQDAQPADLRYTPDPHPIDLRSLADMNQVQVDELITLAEANATFGGTESEGGLL